LAAFETALIFYIVMVLGMALEKQYGRTGRPLSNDCPQSEMEGPKSETEEKSDNEKH